MTSLAELDRKIAAFTAREKIYELKRKIDALNASRVQHMQADIRIALMKTTIKKLERQLIL